MRNLKQKLLSACTTAHLQANGPRQQRRRHPSHRTTRRSLTRPHAPGSSAGITCRAFDSPKRRSDLRHSSGNFQADRNALNSGSRSQSPSKSPRIHVHTRSLDETSLYLDFFEEFLGIPRRSRRSTTVLRWIAGAQPRLLPRGPHAAAEFRAAHHLRRHDRC